MLKYTGQQIWVWLSLVERYLGVVEIARSNRVTQTSKIQFCTSKLWLVMRVWRLFRHTHAKHAGMAELADALDSGSSGGNFVEVQVLLPAPQEKGRPEWGVPFLVVSV